MTVCRLKNIAMVSKRFLALGLLVFQNSSLALIMRYSRTRNSDMYFASTAVEICEALKFFVSVILLYREEADLGFVEMFRKKVRFWSSVISSFCMPFLENNLNKFHLMELITVGNE